MSALGRHGNTLRSAEQNKKNLVKDVNSVLPHGFRSYSRSEVFFCDSAGF